MICASCRHSLLARLSHTGRQESLCKGYNLPTSYTQNRLIATVPGTSGAAPPTPPPSTTTSSSSTPAATSSQTPVKSQPFSEPFFPSTSTASTPPASGSSTTPNASAPIKLVSSVPGGTPLNALSYVKQPTKPLVALEDHEYPAWLWTLVSDPNAPASSSSLDGGINVGSMSKKQRAKFERKQAKLMANVEKPIPLHEQSKDLTQPEEGPLVHAQRQKELTQSMRTARRKGIREANFLRSM